MRSWFDLKAKADKAELYIYDAIGGFGVPVSDLVNQIQGLKGPLNVYINSPGGDVFDGIALYNALTRYAGGVNVTVDGMAASIASVVAQAGTKRTMSKSSAMMIHDAWGLAVGNPAVMEKMRDELDKASTDIADIYADRAGGTAEEWRAKMSDETWYRAEEAVTAGLADEAIVGHVNAYAGQIFNLSKFNNVPDWVQQDDDSNPEEPDTEPDHTDVEEDNSMSDLTAVRAALGLNDEGDVIAAISALKGQAQDLSTGEKGAENALRKENAQLRQQILTVESDYGQRILALEDRNRQKEAAYAVDSAIQQGRVAPKDREIALKLALNDADGFAQFASNLRVDLNERGMAMDAQMAALEPSADEIRIGASMGVTREQLIAQKAADAGITLPA